MAASCRGDGAEIRTWSRAVTIKSGGKKAPWWAASKREKSPTYSVTHRKKHTHRHKHTVRHPPAGRKMSFPSADDSIFRPAVQHSHSRPLTEGLNSKKRIVSERLMLSTCRALRVGWKEAFEIEQWTSTHGIAAAATAARFIFWDSRTISFDNHINKWKAIPSTTERTEFSSTLASFHKKRKYQRQRSWKLKTFKKELYCPPSLSERL